MISEFFSWRTFDVTSFLHPSWADEILVVARNRSVLRELQPPHVTSREAPLASDLKIRGVRADVVRSELPWLEDLYRGLFRDLAQVGVNMPVACAEGDRHSVVLNVQHGTDGRYESHVDTNPIQGLLYVTSHPEGSGGELVVSADRNARCLEDIERYPIRIVPQRGYLLFFDGRFYPHYIRPLTDPSDIRVAVAMNYYTADWPETRRPIDLDDYLAGGRPSLNRYEPVTGGASTSYSRTSAAD